MVDRFLDVIRRVLVPPMIASTPDETTDPEIARIERAVARLPKITCKVLLMHRFEGLNYVEIAYRLGISPRAVEDHIATALWAIRRAREENQQ